MNLQPTDRREAVQTSWLQNLFLRKNINKNRTKEKL